MRHPHATRAAHHRLAARDGTLSRARPTAVLLARTAAVPLMTRVTHAIARAPAAPGDPARVIRVARARVQRAKPRGATRRGVRRVLSNRLQTQAGGILFHARLSLQAPRSAARLLAMSRAQVPATMGAAKLRADMEGQRVPADTRVPSSICASPSRRRARTEALPQARMAATTPPAARIPAEHRDTAPALRTLLPVRTGTRAKLCAPVT